MTRVQEMPGKKVDMARSRSKGGVKGAQARKRAGASVDSYLPRGEYGRDRVKPWEL